MIPPFQDLTQNIKIKQHHEMLSFKSKIPKIRKTNILQPVLPLVPEKVKTSDDDKSAYITFECKTRAGQPDMLTKYKKHVWKFKKGTLQHWINLFRDVQEI